MEFEEKVKEFIKKIENLKKFISTEEATKTSLIMPFFQLLGYDVFNPNEFIPEYVADVGIKKGEKVDYAINLNGIVTILIEAKSINENLQKHDSQLFRYFGTTSARLAILTNGINYKFFTDLEEPNKMDTTPFLEINLLGSKDNDLTELKKFCKDNFDINNIINTASNLKYASSIEKILSEEFSNPSDEFIKLKDESDLNPINNYVLHKMNKKDIISINTKTEILIWLVIILIFVAVCSITFIYKSQNDENDYQIFLPDVDGLIVGSPVRMMGVEVGYVVKIKPVKDEVYVKFVLTNPEVYIPQGSSVTVEFSGMAGSKSLELYVPQKGDFIDEKTPIIEVNPPKRLYDALYLLDDMYKKIGSIIYSISSFSDKVGSSGLSESLPKNESDNMEEFLKYSDTFLDNLTKKTEQLKNNIEDFKNNAKQIQ